MKKTLTIIATAALMGTTAFAPLAIAQEATQTAPANPGATAPATPEVTPTTPMTPAAPNTSADAGAASGTYLTEQSPTQISANDYIGSAVYTGASGEENIGNVTNLILEENGGITAAVVGVGGFLGIGTKDVAVPMDKISMTRDTENGSIRLTTTETADSLKAAPEFKTMEDKASESASTPAPATPDNTTTSSTNP